MEVFVSFYLVYVQNSGAFYYLHIFFLRRQVDTLLVLYLTTVFLIFFYHYTQVPHLFSVNEALSDLVGVTYVIVVLVLALDSGLDHFF